MIDADRLGNCVGDYEIVRFLGEGGMGTVFEAKHKDLGRIAALKVIQIGSNNEALAEQFLREARLAATVEHPNLVTLYDIGRVDDLLYMSMRHINGGDVDQKLKREGILSEQDALNVMMDCTRALEAIYRADMVHRDIKPGNIFLDSTGMAYLGDLGLACLVSDKASQEGSFAGTPAFTSPEQAQAQNLDIRTDIYSLGAVYYVMTCASRPFEGRSPFEVLGKVISAPTPDPRETNPSCSEARAAIIMRAMAKDRELRYATPHELLEDLMALARNQELIHTRTCPIGQQPTPKTERYNAQGEIDARLLAETERQVTVLKASGIALTPEQDESEQNLSLFKRLWRGLFGFRSHQ